MKSSLKLSVLAVLLAQGIAHATNPVQGWYAGIMLGGTYTPKTSFTFTNPLTRVTATGHMSYGGLGDFAGQLGYRFWDHYRVEGELVYNSSEYKSLKVGNYTISRSKKTTGLRLKGKTATGAFMVNGIYDFITPGCDTSFSPYVGLGLGYARVSNILQYYNNDTELVGQGISRSTSSPALQGIIGAAYFLDDYTWFGLDFRYFTTKSTKKSNATHTVNSLDSRVQFDTINLSFSGIFNCA